MSKVIDLSEARLKKQMIKDAAEGRSVIYIKDGKAYGNPYLYPKNQDNLPNRIDRIRTSLDKINELMQALKELNETTRKVDLHVVKDKNEGGP